MSGPVVWACRKCGAPLGVAQRGQFHTQAHAVVERIDADGSHHVRCSCGHRQIWEADARRRRMPA